ncbi:MAG: hypothetical protein GY869_23485, partial [Planctomycetes bacterium]|nr:hypothetical protein [Planctomycetota bacterium]
IIYLCLLAVFIPKIFIKEEEKDKNVRKDFPPAEIDEHPIYIVRRALAYSLCLIILSIIGGGLSGWFMYYYFNKPNPYIIPLLQVIGACLLLWGTLFVRGWEIRSYSGVQLRERVNQWIYRFLCSLGTFIIICSLAWDYFIRNI